MSAVLLSPTVPFKLRGASGHDDGASVVCIILDVNPSSWRQRFEASAGAAYEQAIESICVFVRAMLLSHWPVSLDLTVMCTAPGAPFLFRSQEHADASGVIDQLPCNVGPRIRHALADLASWNVIEPGKQCSITGALSRALCYVRQRRKAFASALVRRSNGSVDARIVCVHVDDTDNYAEYVPFMNAVFAAQKEHILIDAVALSVDVTPPAPDPVDVVAAADPAAEDVSSEDLPSLLSQASRMTNGLFSKATPGSLLQILICKYHTGERARGLLRLPGDGGGPGATESDEKQERGTSAAICFCHKRLITRGFVCSVCLTVLCTFAAQCPTCGSRFTLDTSALPITRPPPPAVPHKQLPAELLQTIEEREKEKQAQMQQQKERERRLVYGFSDEKDLNYN